MKLTELDPRWLLDSSGKRVGFAFISPTKAWAQPIGHKPFWQTCMENPPQVSEQIDLWDANGFEDHHFLQPCNPNARWTIAGGIENASFETMTVTPSLNGADGGLWHGHITNGVIVGGI